MELTRSLSVGPIPKFSERDRADAQIRRGACSNARAHFAGRAKWARKSDGVHARMRAPTSPCPRSTKLTLSVSRRYFTMARRDFFWSQFFEPAAWGCHRAMRPGRRETTQATRQRVQE